MTRARRLLVTALISVLVFAVVPTVEADDLNVDLQSVRNRIGSLNNEIDAASASRSALARDIQATAERMDEVLESMASTRMDVIAVESELGQKRGALREVRSDLHAKYQSLAQTRSELGTARIDAANYAIESYMSAGLGVPTVALSAKVWTDIGIGLAYLDRITASGTDTVQRFESLLVDEQRASDTIAAHEATLLSDVADLEATEERLGSLQNELQRSSDALQDEYRRQRSLLASYETEIEEIEGEIASLEKEQSSIKKLIAERARAAGAAPGSLVRPVPGGISSGFGPRIHPIYGYSLMHNGVDMNGGMGQQIVAAAGGIVFFAGVKGGYGNSIMIDHGGGMVTLYAHQSRFAVSHGQKVTTGQVIGYVGSTGVSTAPHLHFEVRINGNPVNPTKYF
ncbi:MAG: peptidoglycan DD-metalloendopeptidase family protein [Actinomycetota bacterium]|nr:peptidoglycan DD-metalloendopeptidase family protein [Actinomycetota bacterium]